MPRKRTNFTSWTRLRCQGFDGDAEHGSWADGSFRSCSDVATYRVRWVTATVKIVRSIDRWSVQREENLACDRHLRTALDRADRAVAFARSPFRRYDTVPEIIDPTLTRLEFVLNKRAAAHGQPTYTLVETPVTDPVPLILF